jgi:hypothetical protein
MIISLSRPIFLFDGGFIAIEQCCLEVKREAALTSIPSVPDGTLSEIIDLA